MACLRMPIFCFFAPTAPPPSPTARRLARPASTTGARRSTANCCRKRPGARKHKNGPRKQYLACFVSLNARSSLRRMAGSTLRVGSRQRAAVYPPTDGPLFPSMRATQGEPGALFGVPRRCSWLAAAARGARRRRPGWRAAYSANLAWREWKPARIATVWAGLAAPRGTGRRRAIGRAAANARLPGA